MQNTRIKHTPAIALATDLEGHEDARESGEAGHIWGMFAERGGILSPWGSRQRLHELLLWYLHDRNAMVRSVFSSLAKKISSTPWEISGPGDVSQFQELLHEANSSKVNSGWDDFIQITVLNMLIFDTGAKWLLHGAGPVDGPLYGPVTSISTLDPLRVYSTRDPIHPYVYYPYRSKKDSTKTKYILHHTRVVSLVDSPVGDVRFPGWGLSALSRAITIANREILMDRYIQTSLDDKPKPGILMVGGVMEAKFEVAKGKLIQGLTADEMDVFGQTLILFGASNQSVPQATHLAFSGAPEKFDFVGYTELDAKQIALAVGIDPQDVLPLSSGNLGTGTQTEILAAQARGKTEGDARAKITRGLNFSVLPTSVKFEMKYQDSKEDEIRAGIAATHAQVVQTVANAAQVSGTPLAADDIVRYLVQVDDTWRNVFINADGSIRSLTDFDPEPEPERVASDTTEVEEDVSETTESSEPVAVNTAMLEAFKIWEYTPRLTGTKLKAWVQTRLEFINALTDTLADHQTGIRGRTLLGQRIRRLLNDLGTQAFVDGLAEGGVTADEMDAMDKATIKQWLLDQHQYWGRMADEAYPNKWTPAQASARAELWANKSLRQIYMIGKVSAEKNKKLMWNLGATEVHCRDCLRLNGQVHRARAWRENNWLPGSQRLECKGYKCDCFFSDANDQIARGRF